MRQAYFYSILLILLSSCQWKLTPKNAPTRQYEIVAKEFDVFAAAANRFLPCKDSLGSSDTLIVTDTAFLPGQVIEVQCPPNGRDTVRIRTVCPPGSVVTNTVYIRDSFYTLDSRGIADLQGQLSNVGKELAVSKADRGRLKEGRNLWRIIALSACGLLAIIGVFKVKSLFTPTVRV